MHVSAIFYMLHLIISDDFSTCLVWFLHACIIIGWRQLPTQRVKGVDQGGCLTIIVPQKVPNHKSTMMFLVFKNNAILPIILFHVVSNTLNILIFKGNGNVSQTFLYFWCENVRMQGRLEEAWAVAEAAKGLRCALEGGPPSCKVGGILDPPKNRRIRNQKHG